MPGRVPGGGHSPRRHHRRPFRYRRSAMEYLAIFVGSLIAIVLSAWWVFSR